MRKIIVSFLLSFVSISLCFAAEADKPKLFIMLNVDNTIVDRISPENISLMEELAQQGYTVQKLEFDTTAKQSPKFASLYRELARGEKDTKESEYMSRIKVQQIADDTFHITEYIVIRPGLKKFLEDVENIEIPTFILICSRNDDARTQNLVNKFDLSIDGKKFVDVVDFVPRRYFRVKITLPDYPGPVTAKSAVELRKQYHGKYGPITDNDHVILIDKLEDTRFITSNPTRDLNVRVSEFNVSEDFNQSADDQELKKAVLKIKEFLERSSS